jgi:AAA+ ATPase superfamily predicted ATPase
MIFLIGGAPRVGKSTIAKQFARSIKGRFVSTDELEMPQEFSVAFYSDAQKNTLTPQERMQGVINEAKQVVDAISDIIRRAENYDQDTVIEGVHLLPTHVAGFIENFGADNIKSIFIGSTNIEAILQGVAQNTSPNNWLKGFEKKVLTQIAQFTQFFSRYLCDGTKKYNLIYKERSSNFQKDVIDIIAELTSPKE